MSLPHSVAPYADGRTPARRDRTGGIASGASDRWLLAGLFILGLLLVVAMGVLAAYKNSAGGQAEGPAEWPRQSRLQRSSALPTLVMFAHPMCPCTSASLAELRALMSEFEGRVTALVLFALPTGVGDDWATSDSWASASSIPGVRTGRDAGEYESQLFGAETSGHVVLYSRQGRLLFRGGITGARGHVGANDGRTRLASLLRESSTALVPQRRGFDRDYAAA